MKCEKLLFEKEDVVGGLIDLIASHGVTNLVMQAAADRHYSRYAKNNRMDAAEDVLFLSAAHSGKLITGHQNPMLFLGFRKMVRPKSRTAIEILQRADPSCKIWFVCKGQLICTRYSHEWVISGK